MKNTKTIIASVLVGSTLAFGATTPFFEATTTCNHVYYDDPTYVPLGALEEAIYAIHQMQVVYREAKLGTNLFVDCVDSYGRIYSIELSEIEYEKMKTDIHKPTLPQKTVKRAVINI